jgi:hypothetical protein
MQTISHWAAIFAAFLMLGFDSVADEPAVKWPREGSWANYHVLTKTDRGEESAGKMTLKSLNKTTVDAVPCRWFESEYVAQAEPWHERRKFLVPERAVDSSERPLDEVLRNLQRDNAAAVAAVSPEAHAWMPTDVLYFPGFLKNAKRVDDPRTVKYQRGEWQIPQAHVGTYRWWRKGKPPEESSVWETTYRVWLHPDLPVGFAHAATTLKLIVEGKEVRTWQQEFALQEFGDHALPAIVEESAPSLAP